jgi:ER-bound oxygenase mpaB/B'/Rubber oxygenase, catalytic domain
VSTSTVTTWPTERGRRTGIVAQFGTDRTDLLEWALITGDPLADAVVAEIQTRGPAVRTALSEGIRHGLAALSDPPPAVAALLTATEQPPDYADDSLLEHGSEPFYTCPGPVHMISLSAGALVRVYESPSISKVLATTGRLIDGADRRIRETGKWLNVMMLPGGLRPGRPGYVATLQVRMLHANMRHLSRNRGFAEDAYGAPINQVDLARTWMDFTVTSLRAEHAMGFGLTSAETAQLYRYWWLAGHLLGIDARLIEGIASNEQATRVDDLLQSVTGPLIAESVVLAAATLASVTTDLHAALNIPEPLGGRALQCLARRFHGDAIADELQLPRSPATDAVLTQAIQALHSRRIEQRKDPKRWAAQIAKNLAGTRDFLKSLPGAQYET